jgi:serine-type D-Ala-D-Ala carboxypeptidase/endopeptidase (penicillin-binding protein 4)
MRRLTVLAVVLLTYSAMAQTSAKQAEREGLKAALQTVIDTSPLKAARVSVLVKSLDDGTIVFAKDADELLNPASNVKLFTAGAALATLGPEFRFETEFLTDTELKSDGKAKILFVRGKGDPTINSERLWGMVADLTHHGLKEVQDIVIDDDFFDGERQAPGFDQESGDKAYLAPSGAVSLNWNTVGVFLRPGESVGARGHIEVEPPTDFFVVEGGVTTGAKNQRRYTVSSKVDKDKVRQKLTVEGVVPLEKGVWSVWKKVDSPPLYFGYTLRSVLNARGIKVKGRIRTGETPRSARMFFTSQSETLDMVLKRLNKTSSNFVAEQLLKTLGAELKGQPGTSAQGAQAVEDFLSSEVGLPRGSFIMRNGSGLNDANRFSATQTVALLEYMWRRLSLTPEYISALPIGGKDGTLKYRFEGTDAVGRLRAKTGTLENVTALSGYVQAVGGERFAFSIMVNDFAGRVSQVVQHLDTLGAAVAAVGSTAGPKAAVASLTQPASVVGSLEEVKTRLTTYRGLALQADKRNAPFLRSAWRTERDPAVRALIADALYQSDPREPSTLRMLLDSALPTEEVWGRLRKVASSAKIDVPLLPALVEVAAGGQVEAIARLFEFARASASDESVAALMEEQLLVVAHDAPTELLAALRVSQGPEREVAIDLLTRGLARSPQAPLNAALKSAQTSAEPSVASFAKEVESALNAPPPPGG